MRVAPPGTHLARHLSSQRLAVRLEQQKGPLPGERGRILPRRSFAGVAVIGSLPEPALSLGNWVHDQLGLLWPLGKPATPPSVRAFDRDRLYSVIACLDAGASVSAVDCRQSKNRVPADQVVTTEVLLKPPVTR